MLSKDTRFLHHRQGTLILAAEQRPWRSCSYHHPHPQAQCGWCQGTQAMLFSSYHHSWNCCPPRLREYASFTTGCKHTCSLLQGRHYLYYIGKYTICPLPRRDTVALCSKGACYTHILGKMVWNKRAVTYRMCGNMTHGRTSLPALLLSENTVPSPLLAIPPGRIHCFLFCVPQYFANIVNIFLSYVSRWSVPIFPAALGDP